MLTTDTAGMIRCLQNINSLDVDTNSVLCLYQFFIVRFFLWLCCCVPITLPCFAQELASPLQQLPAQTNSGRGLFFPLEPQITSSVHSEAEGLLGRLFPRLHGTDALHFDYVYTGGIFNNARGGMRTKGATAYNGVFDLGITADTKKLGLWDNGTFYVHSFFSHGKNPSRYIQDYQEVSVFAYETPAQVSEYWYKHCFFNDSLHIKAGKQDAGGDFFYLGATGDFLNAAATCVPTTNIPTYPENAWGISGLFMLTENFHIRAGFFDAHANANQFWMSEEGGIYFTYQIEYHTSLFGELPGFFYAGVWYDDSEYELLEEENHGFNFGFEQMIYRRHICDDKDLRGITVYYQYADASQDRNELKGYWALGLRWLGMFEERPEDSLGFAVNRVRFSPGYCNQEGLHYSSETAYELYYRIRLSDYVALQPDLQYIVHPGGRYRDAIVPGLVFQVVF